MIIDTKKNLSMIFKIIIENEKKLDNYRQILFDIEDFSPLILFYEIDRDKKNFITETDIANYLQ